MKKQVKVLLGFLCFLFVCVFAYSGYQMLSILHGYKEDSDQYDELRSQYVSTAGTPSLNDVAYQNSGTQASLESSPISVDFDSLRAQNDDVAAWLYCEGTVINYVVVHGDDNDYYLHRFMDGRANAGGTLFVDWMCGANFSGRNTVIYGHNMNDGSMFASLLKYAKQEYYDEHPVMYLNTPDQDYRIELFAGYVTSATSDVYTIGFSSDEYYMDYLNKMVSQSNFRSDVTLTAEDKIVTLSTCAYDFTNARYVVQGKLVPIGDSSPAQPQSSAVG